METPTTQNQAASEEGKEAMLDQGRDRADTESHGDESPAKAEIPRVNPDDLAVQILARLDGTAYRQALYQDAGSINDNFLMPRQFPWHSKKRLPQKMKTMPRDIDDLHVVSHCDAELHAEFGDFAGAFGFGRYENGQSRGNYCNALSAETLSKDGSGATAAARRSHDPGVLELHVSTMLPASIDAVIDPKQPLETQAPAKKWRSDLMKDPKQAEMLSKLPFHWGEGGESSSSVPQQVHQPVSGDGDPASELDAPSRKLFESKARSKAQLDVASSCRRKLSVSVKAIGVSSRSTVLPQSTVLAERASENTRKVLRPMLCLASLPPSVQAGETVSTEKARELDNAGLAHTLGSYDCRFVDALVNPKKDGGRSKRTTVGRTRLVWSSLIRGDEPFLPSTRNRVSFNSLITGQRVDASKCLRPTEVKVAVRLNGSILMEEALEEIPATTTSNVRKRTRQTENQGSASKPRKRVVPESRTAEEIDAALDIHCVHIGNPEEGRVIRQKAKNGTVVYLEMGARSSSHSDLDRNDVIASLLKLGQKKAPKRLKSASSDMSIGAGPAIRRSSPPRFACVPLEDGVLRTICLNAGSMAASAVHQIIRDVSEQESERRCSVCWSDEGSGKEGVLECAKCGLLAHATCCLDKGEFSPASSNILAQDLDVEMNGHVAETAGQPSSDQAENWQCAVCCRFTESKPRRNPRMPSRFVGGETYTTSNGADVSTANANTPGPRCGLCPHRGGAMSQMETSDASGRCLWAHEVCRVWSGLGASDEPSLECSFSQPTGSPLSNVCSLCGTGGAGLTRCAARGCLVAFHPMCALLSNKVGTGEKSGKAKATRTRKTRHTDQASEGKKSDADESFEADRKLCREYTLQLVQVSRSELSMDSSGEEDAATTIPIAFCGIHNAGRDDRFFGCLPGGTAI